jgi:hypothetical protein
MLLTYVFPISSKFYLIFSDSPGFLLVANYMFSTCLINVREGDNFNIIVLEQNQFSSSGTFRTDPDSRIQTQITGSGSRLNPNQRSSLLELKISWEQGWVGGKEVQQPPKKHTYNKHCAARSPLFVPLPKTYTVPPPVKVSAVQNAQLHLQKYPQCNPHPTPWVSPPSAPLI